MMTDEAGAPPEHQPLPTELLQQVFMMLPWRELARCEQVCRRWREVARDRRFWWRMEVIVYREDIGSSIDKISSFMASHGKYIESLEVDITENVSDLEGILAPCDDLTSLKLTKMVENSHWQSFVSKLQNLKELRLATTTLTEPSTTHLSFQFDSLPRLSILELHHQDPLDESSRESLLRCKLSSIKLWSCRGFDLPYMEKLIASQQLSLVKLHIDYNTRFNEDCCRQLALCPLLEYVYVEVVTKEVLDLFKSLFQNFIIEEQFRIYCQFTVTMRRKSNIIVNR